MKMRQEAPAVPRAPFGERDTVVESKQVGVVGGRVVLDEDHAVLDQVGQFVRDGRERLLDVPLELFGRNLNRHGRKYMGVTHAVGGRSPQMRPALQLQARASTRTTPMTRWELPIFGIGLVLTCFGRIGRPHRITPTG